MTYQYGGSADEVQGVPLCRSKGGRSEYRRPYNSGQHLPSVRLTALALILYIPLTWLYSWFLGIIISVVLSGLNHFFTSRCEYLVPFVRGIRLFQSIQGLPFSSAL